MFVVVVVVVSAKEDEIAKSALSSHSHSPLPRYPNVTYDEHQSRTYYICIGGIQALIKQSAA